MKKTIIGVISLFMLAGCANKAMITEEDALEVCLDAIGYRMEEIRNAEVKKDDGYTVTFDSNTNDYTFKVNDNGIIESRKIEALPESEVIEDIEDKKEDKTPSDIDPAIEEKAVDNSLKNWGVTREYMASYSIEKDPDRENMWKVHIELKDGRKFVTVTTEEGKPVSSYSE